MSRYPLTPMQQGMVVASSREPAAGLYLQQLVCSLHEELETRCLREAWERTVERHAILRSTVELDPGGLFQSVCERAAIPWEERDWSSLPAVAQEEALREFLAIDRARGFDFGDGPPHRFAVIRCAPAHHRIVWTHHHVLIDRHARLLVLRELFARYDALRGNGSLVSSAPPPAFADHVRWLQQQDWRRSEPYWRKCLQGVSEPVRLPIDEGRHAATDGEDRHARDVRSFSVELTVALESTAERCGVTLNTLIQGAWAILLSRYSGQRDVVFGATRGCRRSSVQGAQAIIGPLLNTVPVRVSVAPDALLLPWLQELRAQWVALRDHENTPLARIHEWSDMPVGVPLFGSVVVFERQSLNSVLQDFGGEWKHRTAALLQRSDTPLTLFGHGKPMLELGVAFDRHRFTPQSIDRLLGHLRTLLESFIRAPHSRLGALPLLTDAERLEILDVWNDTARDYPRHACAQHLFEEQVRAGPARPALICGELTLSYAETNARANRLARHLAKRGIGPERLVGVLLPRSPEAVIAMLAILKAGGGFLLLDPDSPRQRLQQIVGDAHVAAVITTRELSDRLGSAELNLICLDAERESLAREPQDDPPPSASAQSLAYAVYTSGTTGKPKGTLVTHRSLVNHTISARERYGFTVADRRLQFVPLSSDVIVAEVFTPLASGAALVLGFEPARASIDEFLRFVDDNGVTVTGMPATYWHEWVASMADGEPVLPRSLRLVVSGMEQVQASAYEAWQRRVGGRLRWCNAYGPTETTCTAAMFEAPAGDLRRAVVPIGKPIANARIYLFDQDRNLVPVGVPGEIYIGGDGVARGYLNQPELTAARFVADPFSGDPEARLYRTGDLGVWLPDGNIVFLGRLDDQMKIRGYRVEPGEIEAVLRQHPDVRHAAVALRGEGAEQRLCAYVVPHAARSPAGDDLRGFLAARLPPHMVPAAVVPIDRLPLTPTGKVDRARLPAPARDQILPLVAQVAPANEVESRMAALWEEILGQRPIGVHTDFFSVGGDSLMAVLAATRIQSVFGIQIPVRDVFANPTVAGLSRVVARLRASAPSDRGVAPMRVERPASATGGGALDAPTIPRRAEGTDAPLSHAQARAWFLHRLDPASAAYHESRLWRIDGSVDVAALGAALRAVAMRQPMLRTRFVSRAGVPVQVIDADPTQSLELVALSTDSDDEERCLAHAVRERVARPFDLAAATPLRWTLFDLGGQRRVLLRVWHHILGDALSSRILQREISEAYVAARAHRDPSLPALAVDYADYAAWQAGDLAGPKLERLLTLWKARLADLPAPAFPTDFTRPAKMSSRGAIATAPLSRAAVAALEAVGRRHGATSFVTLLAAFQALLSRLSGATDIVVGTPVAGRTLPELQPIVGFFANMLVVRVDLSGEPTTETLLQRVRERLLEALEHQEVPFEKLVEALGVPRDASRNPLFQIAFAVREPDSDGLRLEGAAVHPVESGIGYAKFDLTATVWRNADGADVRIAYCADLFEPATVERMARQYALLVEGMAADPQCPLAKLPLMDAAARERMRLAASLAAPSYPVDVTVHRRFAAQAASSPRVPAIGALDYAGLDAAANRMARELRAKGAGGGTYVAVAQGRSEDIAIAWLAVLKTGAAYLPIDPDLPAERIEFMLDDARVRHAIADAPVANRLARPGMCVLCPEREAESIAAHAAEPPEDRVRPDDPAYVIYTSGSTGSPKGVVVPHRAVLRLVCGTDYVELGCGDVVAQLANPAFDASTFEFWGPLLNGARIVPIAKATAIAPRALAAAIAQQGITTLFVTTALFNAVAREVPDAFRPCKNVLFGGEAVEPRWVRAVLSAGPPARLLHVYGPTETTTFATWHRILDVAPDAASIPIGRPVSNTSVCVLRPDLELAAPGEPGEIWIGGPGVALGYLARPELTAERFVDGPAGALPPGRWYRTGDRARLREDGAIEFLGRSDRQVKVRGHRVELDEIEAALQRLPQVGAALVSVRGETTDTRRIVAHLVRADASAPPPANVLRELRRMLPDYMLPGSIVWMPSLPLNASGKVDRRSLASPDNDPSQRRGDRVPPRDMFEQLLARIWEDLLDVRDIGVFDHFFEIGGHSLLAARLVDAVEQETGLALPLTMMFADDTLAGMAEALRGETPNGSAPILSFNEKGTLPPFVFLHGDFTGGGFYSRALVQALGPEQPVLIVHPHGLVEGTVPPTIEAMAAERVRALRSIRPHGPWIVGGHCNGAFVAFEMARLLMEEGEQVPAVVVIEARAPGSGSRDARARGEHAWLAFDAAGKPQVIAARDRQSDLWLRYLQAMDGYGGHAFAGHLAIVQSHQLRDARHERGWSRLAASAEIHVLPGDHVTLITRHAAELAEIIRRTIARSCVQATS